MLRILNDPDTGREKLQPGSPPDAVRRVQQALFDLGWTLQIDPPVRDESEFVIGIYGPRTTATVLAFRTHYNIYWPPSAPSGQITGTVGPRTLQRLDRHCVLHDAGVVAIEQKATDLQAAGVNVKLDETRPHTRLIFDTSGVFREAQIDGEPGRFLAERRVGAFAVRGPILDEYIRQGGPAGRLGFPVRDEQLEADGARRSDFEGGLIRYHPSTREMDVEPQI